MIKKVRVEEAIGMALAHDITKVADGFKGPAFKRGHIIKEEEIPDFYSIGKEHIYILELDEGEVHEEEAALRIADAVIGSGLEHTAPSEGRVNIITTQKGLLKVNIEGVNAINAIGDITVTTVHNNTVYDKGRAVAGMRIIPLFTKDEKLQEMEKVAEKYKPVISLAPFVRSKIGLVITGNEVYKGTIKDAFSPTIKKKVAPLGCEVNNEAIVPDDSDIIARTIIEFKEKGSEVIMCSSGMSVDPDDATPEGIRKSGADIHFYGIPVMSGAMFLFSKLGDTPVLGVPACVLHAPTTAFDKLLPIVLTGEDLTFEETRKLGYGGFCLKCDVCRYPVCPFCK